MNPGVMGVTAFGFTEATIVALLLTLVGLAFRFGHQSARLEKLEESVRGFHRRLDELRDQIDEVFEARRG